MTATKVAQKTTLARLMATAIDARNRCAETGNEEWYNRWDDLLERIERNCLPSGSGIDCGTKIDPESTPDKLTMHGSYHVMNEVGYYIGWIDYTVTVTASLQFGVDVDVTLDAKPEDPEAEAIAEDIADYLHQVYSVCLTEEIDHPEV